MDLPRHGATRRKKIKNTILGILTVVAIGAIAWGLSRLEPAPPSVDRSSVYIGQVEAGSMTIEVRGPGTLVPEEIRWVAAGSSGRVELIYALPGSEVRSDTILMDLTNPELEREALDAELQLRQGMAEMVDLKVALEQARLAQEALTASVQTDFQQSRIQAEVNEELAKAGLISVLTLQLSRVTVEEMAARYEVEKKRLDIAIQSTEARIAAKEAEIARQRGSHELRRRQVGNLRVRAGISGVLQQMPVEVGQQVAAGEILGRVAVPGRLKAQLRIPETQAKDVRHGLAALIDTRNGIVPGVVARIDPAAQEGTVRVDVTLQGELPPGARPDLNVDGTIQIERLDQVLKIGRPAYAQADSRVEIFRLNREGTEAARVQVRLGRSSVTQIEVVEGLAAGDRVILSDSSNWDRYDRIRLK